MKKHFVLFIMLFAFLYGSAENNFINYHGNTDMTKSLQPGINADEHIPILAWYSIPSSQTSVERYKELREDGITYSFSSFPNLEEVKKALEAAEQADVKLMISCPQLNKDPEGTVKQLMKYPALAGYHLKDEPNMEHFSELSVCAKKIQSIDKKHFCYVNMFPNYATPEQLKAESYEEYVAEYYRQIPVSFGSFDFYPILKNKVIEEWYKNLEVVSAQSMKAGKPFWAFVLTTNYDNNHLTPQSLPAMRLQAYTNLAYGAQGIEYFTYWSATSVNTPSGEDQRGAPISATGKRSILYDRVKQLSQEIKDLSWVFSGARVISVRHTGTDMIPAGTIRLTSLPDPVKVLDTHGSPALVSVLQNGEKSFLVIVNKDFLNSMKYTIYGDESLKRVLKDGTVVPAGAYEPSMELDPGDVGIYMFP